MQAAAGLAVAAPRPMQAPAGMVPSSSGRPAPLRGPYRAPRTSPIAAARKGKPAMSEVDLYVQAQPQPQQQPAGGPPLYVAVPLGLAVVVGALRALRAFGRRGSHSELSERGFVRDSVADEKYYTRALRGYKTVQYEELSEEQILAARRRRSAEMARDMPALDLDQVQLPENHPFAVKQSLSPEEEALQAQRLSARRRLSPEDAAQLRAAQAAAAAQDGE